jgi:two-component system OmpR family sensor kinase
MGLFAKIFLSFGIAMTVTLAGAIMISFRLASDAFDQINIEGREQVINAAAEALARGGEPELRRWIGENPGPLPGLTLFVLDADGNDLLDRPLPRALRRLLRGSDRDGDGGTDTDGDGRDGQRGSDGDGRDGDGDPDRNDDRGRDRRNLRPVHLTPYLIGGEGSDYRLLFARAPVTFFGVLTWPGTQVAMVAIAIIAGALTSLLLAGYLSSPITRLQRATRALAAGALETRVGQPTNRRRDEVGRLARDFDAMAERIQALVLAKETLLRDVSHELRSPLARIRVATALAERHANEQTLPDLERIEQECERLEDLVGQIMTLTRLRTQSPIAQELLRLDELVAQVVEDARFEHAGRDIRYEAHSERAILGDPRWLRSAVENVVRNALVYGGAEQPIWLTVTDEQSSVVLRVADSGPGVPEEALARIFEPFYRADESRDHRIDGHGIGLAITARVVALHAGSVEARNRPDGGLELAMRFPAAPAA